MDGSTTGILLLSKIQSFETVRRRLVHADEKHTDPASLLQRQITRISHAVRSLCPCLSRMCVEVLPDPSMDL